ncbi:hypothetical protein MYX76_01395 [Desulfobacterota bacterium AH_259_B03_O07]|nr:hypothetical protein [Desulfobacterota bacterium AH_259_B03_O07]
MPKIKDMSIEDLEQFVEQKILEVLGDPDSGLKLNDKFKKKLQKRLRDPSQRLSHQEVLKKLG